MFHRLTRTPELTGLQPILVTGTTVMVDASHDGSLVERFNAYLQERNLLASCSYRETAMPSVREVVGEGRDWSSCGYVGMVTAAFEAGITRCLVGTRGIFGEGWDSLAMNTLIDLTSVTTSTSVQQLRGRSIRKDPAWPRKVAHNWDVVCVAPHFKRGDADLQRFVARHNRYWGIVPLARMQQLAEDSGPSAAQRDPLDPEPRGQIVKSVAHVSPQLAYQLAVRGFEQVNFERHTRMMLREVAQRDRVYDLWGIGEEYSNVSDATIRLDASDLKIRTVATVQHTLKRMLAAFSASAVGIIGLAAYGGLVSGGRLLDTGTPASLLYGVVGLILALVVVIALAANARKAYRIAAAFLVEQPPDTILLDAGRALLAALQEAELVSRSLRMDAVQAIAQPDDSYQVRLDAASPEDAATFIQAYGEMFEPVTDQRYLILRDERRLSSRFLTPLWTFSRRAFRSRGLYASAYHPVPKALAARKEQAEVFARHWEKYVGGGELVFTRNEPGRKLLLEARAQRRPQVKGLAFEIWR